MHTILAFDWGAQTFFLIRGWKDTWQTKLANQGYSSTAIYLQIRTTDVQPYPAELVTSLSKGKIGVLT
jgi:hypothetical protein